MSLLKIELKCFLPRKDRVLFPSWKKKNHSSLLPKTDPLLVNVGRTITWSWRSRQTPGNVMLYADTDLYLFPTHHTAVQPTVPLCWVSWIRSFPRWASRKSLLVAIWLKGNNSFFWPRTRLLVCLLPLNFDSLSCLLHVILMLCLYLSMPC